MTSDNLMFTDSILEIYKIVPEDDGVYLCTASNGDSSVTGTATTRLNVLTVNTYTESESEGG